MAFLRGSSIYCITEKEIKTSTREAFSYICISTATISSFGATVQLVNWYKKLRLSETRRVLSPAARVIFSLALADLFTCLGAIAMSILFLKFEPAQRTRDGHVKPAHHYYIWIGLPIESFTMFSYISSYMWTLFYSVDVCLRAHDLQSSFSGIIYHVLSWPLAAWLVACVQFAVFYDDSIKLIEYWGIFASTASRCSSAGPIALLHYLVCFFPLLLVMICLPIVYWKAYRKVSQNIRNTGYFTDAERKVQKSIRRKFCYIIVVFIFCWLPNFCDGFHDIAQYIVRGKSLFQDSDHSFLWLIEASVNPLQGFLNCLVYGQNGQFISCFNHIQNLFHSNDPPVDGNHQEQNLTWTINSLSGSVKIPVTEISPLLAGSRRSTPVLSSPTSNTPSQREPFHAKLLGEFSHSTKLQ